MNGSRTHPAPAVRFPAVVTQAVVSTTVDTRTRQRAFHAAQALTTSPATVASEGVRSPAGTPNTMKNRCHHHCRESPRVPYATWKASSGRGRQRPEGHLPTRPRRDAPPPLGPGEAPQCASRREPEGTAWGTHRGEPRYPRPMRSSSHLRGRSPTRTRHCRDADPTGPESAWPGPVSRPRRDHAGRPRVPRCWNDVHALGCGRRRLQSPPARSQLRPPCPCRLRRGGATLPVRR